MMAACLAFSLSVHVLGALALAMLPYSVSLVTSPAATVDAGADAVQVSLARAPTVIRTELPIESDIAPVVVPAQTRPRVYFLQPDMNWTEVVEIDGDSSLVDSALSAEMFGANIALPDAQFAEDSGAASPSAWAPIDLVPGFPPRVALRLPSERSLPDGEAPFEIQSDARGAVTNASVKGAISLRYPVQSRMRGEQGVVVLDVQVLASGRVGEIRVLAHPGHNRLVAAAIDAVRSTTFAPAMRDGSPVVSWLETPVRFILK